MKALILCAGQGRRLLPMTASTPKCLLKIHDKSVIEWQIDQLLKCGITDITAVVGFGAKDIQNLLSTKYEKNRISTIYNPFYEVADNLATCWMAKEVMYNDLVLINGDTLFEPAVLQILLDASNNPITVCIDYKETYDDDDMKVSLNKSQLLRIGKTLTPEQSHAESIGVLLLRKEGTEMFRKAVDQHMQHQEGLKNWYLSVIDQLAQSGHVWTQSVSNLKWAEIDYPKDLEQAKLLFKMP